MPASRIAWTTGRALTAEFSSGGGTHIRSLLRCFGNKMYTSAAASRSLTNGVHAAPWTRMQAVRSYTSSAVRRAASDVSASGSGLGSSSGTAASATAKVQSAAGRATTNSSKLSYSRMALIGLTAVSAAGGVTLIVDDDLRNRTYRSVTFWRKMFPIYLHYRLVHYQVRDLPEEAQDEAFDQLHEKYASKVLDVVTTLKGLYIKLAQVGSTRADFVPKPYLDAFVTLQDEVPPRDAWEIKQIIEEELNAPLETVFADFNDVPLGSGSIAQVHEAKLLDGTKVVVKVQYPEAETLWRQDLSTSKAFAALAQPEHLPVLDEITKQFMTEFDFRNESTNANDIRRNLMKRYPKVKVPMAYEHMATKNMMVMEKLEGVKLLDGITEQMKAMAKKRGVPFEQLKEEFEEKLREGKIEKGPSARSVQAYITFLKAKTYTRNVLRGLYNYSLGLVLEPYEYKKVKVPLNLPRLVEELLDVHGHQVLINGVFNGDPHPGNIFLCDDGTLGLIDFGQVKRVRDEDRRQLAKIIIALADDDVETASHLLREAGMKTRENSMFVLGKLAQIWFDKDDMEVTEGKNLQLYMEHLTELDPVETFPQELVMAGRVVILLRGLGTHLQHPLSVAKFWRTKAEKALKETDYLEKESTPTTVG
eukprot:GFYU01004561.1.p1 GENE.GFYU01004561.1~~GFYU01004561.1.p1  ORF type:complete len:646 (-),score=186.86 GFYU01004561.1:56-1993(-)